jgi:UDP-3-O-[3-hydroxymyristoyl] glucosamine N-acyltransferase
MPRLHEIIDYLGCNCNYEDKVINMICSYDRTFEDSLTWAKNLINLECVNSGVVICLKDDYKKVIKSNSVTYLPVDNPRLAFANVISKFYPDLLPDDFTNNVEEFKRRKDLTIGNNVFIGSHVEIGEGTVIHHNAVIYSKTVIGQHCVINAHVSIGTEGLGLEFDPTKNGYVKFPQMGRVKIGNHVEIGPNSTIRRSAIGETIIGNGTKIGSFCNIGHNTVLGENNLLTSNVILAGSIAVGNNVYFGVASSIRNKITVGNNVTIGQGSVVVKDIPQGETWLGNPAKKMNR